LSSTVLDSGDRAVFRGRSLALRPRLTTGLPWTVVHHEANIASRRTLLAIGHGGNTPVVLVDLHCGVSARMHRAGGLGQAGSPVTDAAAARVVNGPRPCIAATTAMAAPTPISASPTLNTLASGIQVGIAKMSVSGPSTTPSTRRLF